MNGAKDVPEREREWMDFIDNCGSRDEIPSTAQGAIRDAYERLRIRRTPKEILERQALSMTSQYDIECYIDDAVNEAIEKGMVKGLEQGLEQGTAQGMDKGLKKGHADALQVMRDLGLPEDKIAEAARRLEENSDT